MWQPVWTDAPKIIDAASAGKVRARNACASAMHRAVGYQDQEVD
jgi:hypothetical protein